MGDRRPRHDAHQLKRRGDELEVNGQRVAVLDVNTARHDGTPVQVTYKRRRQLEQPR